MADDKWFLIVYRPNLKMKSDVDIIRDAKREAMGLPPQPEEEYRPRHDRPQTATDEIVSPLAYVRHAAGADVGPGHGTIQEANAQVRFSIVDALRSMPLGPFVDVSCITHMFCSMCPCRA
jgi:hypothetical protein